MIDLDFLKDLANGFGVSFSTLWIWLCLKVMLFSWDIVEHPIEIRAKAWKFWRAGIFVLTIAMALLYNVENVFRTEGLITEYQSFALLNVAHLVHCVGLSIFLTAMDISTENNHRSLPVYLIVSLMLGFSGVILT